MNEDEEVVRKGSELYNYLHENGFSNFESYECENQKQPARQNVQRAQIIRQAPKWAVDNVSCILKSGLLLEDHRHFVELYYPLGKEEHPPVKPYYLLCCFPLVCLCGGFWRLARTPASLAGFLTAAGVGSVCTVYFFKESFKKRSLLNILEILQQTLVSLEKVFVQFKKMLLLVHQNDFINQNISFRQKEMTELKKKLRGSLLLSVAKLFQFLNKVQEVPLSIDVNSTLQSFSPQDISDTLDMNEDDSCSLDSLKKIFNTYILVQSEFLRRLALCHCPDVWSKATPETTLSYCRELLPDIIKWSLRVQKSLIQEQKFFRVVMETKDKRSQLRQGTSLGWGHSDIYESVRSACLHFQSLLIQTQGLQDILESEYCNQPKSQEDFLSKAAQILNEISEEINAGQKCIDASLVQIFKTINAHQPSMKLTAPDVAPLDAEDSEKYSSSNLNPPVQDEVFELTIPYEQMNLSEEEEWDESSTVHSKEKKKGGETSQKVLQELKTVLIKKAEEWKEREKRAMESKGIPYSAPEQVNVPSCEIKVTENLNPPNTDGCLDFLPTNSQTEWPLPRLKATLKTHRSFRGNKVKEVGEEQTQVDDSRRVVAGDAEIPRIGFGASLLAEAMAKSNAMCNARKEDVFLDSDDEFSSGE